VPDGNGRSVRLAGRQVKEVRVRFGQDKRTSAAEIAAFKAE